MSDTSNEESGQVRRSVDDDDDLGSKLAELYGKVTWKIDNFSEISKPELFSNAFDVGGHKWNILIYPKGCEDHNYLSVFLCVANHKELLPGWSNFAHVTIGLMNKEPKKSKYADTLHRFCVREHDWGWKKFIELPKLEDGFIHDYRSLIITAQVQMIKERVDRPFRCLSQEYKRELLNVYLTMVEKNFFMFVEEKRSNIGRLIEDKSKWKSFCAFWNGLDQDSRCKMSRVKMDVILKMVVKRFFIEREVTSTLVMEYLHSGLKALEEGQVENKKSRPMIRVVENDMFALVDDDVVSLIKSMRAALEPLPLKDRKEWKVPIRAKDWNSVEEINREGDEEKHLTELGRRTLEIFVLSQIFSDQIEVAYQEAIVWKRQEELIREEEEKSKKKQMQLSLGRVIFWGIKTFPKLSSPLEAEATALVWASFCIGNMGYDNYECGSVNLIEAVNVQAATQDS